MTQMDNFHAIGPNVYLENGFEKFDSIQFNLFIDDMHKKDNRTCVHVSFITSVPLQTYYLDLIYKYILYKRYK